MWHNGRWEPQSEGQRLMEAKLHVLCQGVVKSIRETELTLSTGEELPYGLCVWSTGVGPTDFTTSLPFAKSAKGRIAVDDTLRVLVHPQDDQPAPGPTTPADVGAPAEVMLLLPQQRPAAERVDWV